MAAEDLARVIRAKRDLRSLSLQRAAQEANISPAYLSKLESGGVKKPSPTILHQLAPVLEIPYIELMRLAGYVVPNSRGPAPGMATALLSEKLTEEEAEQLMTYLRLLRQQRTARR